jgi:hypothetical protein
MTKKKQGATPKSKSKNVPRKNQTPLRQASNALPKAPVAIGDVRRNARPTLWRRGDDTMLTHVEFVGPIVTDPSNTFAYDVYPLTLENIDTFPWGAFVAQLFEDGEIESLDVIFKSTSPTNASGSVVIGIDYDASDDVEAVTLRELLNWDDTVDTNVWLSAVHRSSRKNLSIMSRLRYNASNGGDERLSSFGNLFVATTGTNLVTQVTGTDLFNQVEVGHLYLRYTVRLGVPTVPPMIGSFVTNGREKAVYPQFAFSAFPAAAISSTANLLAGLAPSDTPVITELEESYGLRVDKPTPATQYRDSTGAYAPTTSPLLICDKDFDGMITFTMKNASTIAGTAPSGIVYDRVDAAVAASPPSFVDAPGVVKYVYDIVDYYVDATNYGVTIVARLALQAGQAIRLAAGLYTAGTSMFRTLTALSGRRGTYDRELLLKNGRLISGLPPAQKAPVPTVIIAT